MISKQTLFLPVSLLLISANPIQAYQYGNPSAAEQAHLEAINYARANPVAEASRLGLSSVSEGSQPGAISTQARAPLTLNAQISSAAQQHSNDMAAKDYFSHYSQDGGLSPFQRMTNAGYSYNSAGENIAVVYSTGALSENTTSLQMHDLLFEDLDYPNRGHRVNILSSSYKEIGIGLGKGEAVLSYGRVYNAHYITTDFGRSSANSKPFVLGVVYNDRNRNNKYNIGEGISHVDIDIVETGGSTRSATAGGWAMPVSAGSYTIKFTLPDGRQFNKAFSISSKNIKIDARLSDFSAPADTGSTTGSGSSGGSSGTASGSSGTSNSSSGTPSTLTASQLKIINSDRLFDWAENKYPELFSPAQQPSITVPNWYYRYYPATNNYVGVNSAGDVYVLGDIFNGLLRIDTLAALLIRVDNE